MTHTRLPGGERFSQARNAKYRTLSVTGTAQLLSDLLTAADPNLDQTAIVAIRFPGLLSDGVTARAALAFGDTAPTTFGWYAQGVMADPPVIDIADLFIKSTGAVTVVAEIFVL